ncbi:GNAT family N-acetyltransferase [Nocardioides sp. Arc9.136]|uniref:GNAT family N-acetyltransferase n=1 Tax=Nocardioides sp. Arc9.136 TaxID=2996826 RepID=UPI00349EACC1
MWTRRFSSGVRRAVRKAERSGVVVERDSTGRLLPQFLALYQESAQRWAAADGMPAWLAARRSARLEPLAKLQRVAAGFGEACVTWMAFVGGRPAAAVIVLNQGANVDYWRGAMTLPLAGPVRANDLLHRCAIEEACRRGAARYSFGISVPGTGLARFKEGFGAVPVPHSGYVLERFPVRRATRTGRRLVRRGGRGGDVRSSAHGRSVSVTAPGGSPCRAAPVRSTGGSSPRGPAGGCRSGR